MSVTTGQLCRQAMLLLVYSHVTITLQCCRKVLPLSTAMCSTLRVDNINVFLSVIWPPYSPWWTLSVIREVTTWIFSWSSLNYRVGQKVTKFRIFSDPARKLSALTPNAAEYCNSEKKLVKHRWFLYNVCHVW